MDQIYESKGDAMEALENYVIKNNLDYIDYRLIETPEGYQIYIILEEEN